MDADRWEKINHAFFATFTLDAERRSALLAKLCSDDPLLMDEVSSLVGAHQQAGEFIQSPVFEAGQLVANIATKLTEGRKFGPYRVVREIDHGGMGAVYLAARDDHEYQKLVAIKIIKTGLDTPFNLRQFYKERQILANLDHPNIARLLDGGTTDDGLPYLVMEYIEGQPIDVYCDAHRLPIPQRLQLFLKVCSAVQHAHQERVIHRDLKPSNILVTPQGEPKLLDFGIAKLLAQTSSAFIEPVTTSLPRMTPEYASPEEARGQGVTTATDIYSLGVVLYELLSGHRPYRLKNRTPEEMFRAICQAAPEKPSASVLLVEEGDSSPVTPERIGELRGDRPERLRQRLAGDLDNIALMAIRKEPQRRYFSVEWFSEDIRRHLAGLPVRARRDTLVYRSGKFVTRNRFGVIAAAFVVMSLLAGALTTRWQAHLAEIERIKVDRRSAEAAREILLAETEANHLRQESEWQKQQSQARLLRRLNQILEAHDTNRGLVINPSSVIFNAGRATLTPDARERLAKVTGALLEYQGVKLQVEGHTDNYGDDAYNQALSEERARAVQVYLVSQGIPRKAITAKGFGGSLPIASNETDVGRQRNRRVEIIVSGDLIGDRLSALAGARRPKLRIASSNITLVAVQRPQGTMGVTNLALNKPATGSTPCNAHEGPEKAFNGTVSGGNLDKWCSDAIPAFLQVDLGVNFSVASFIVRHAGAGGESSDFNTRDFDIQISADGTDFSTVVKMIGNTQGVTMHTIPPTTARFVRLNVIVPGQQTEIKVSRIYELEVYSFANALPQTGKSAR
jgi:serine/threonine protein kinase/outer membrane protein OmpA-like peptidoglycan-associated protein